MLKTAKFWTALLVGVTVLVGGCGKEEKATTRPTTAEAEEAAEDGQGIIITKATKMAGEATKAAKDTGAKAAKTAAKAAESTGAKAAKTAAKTTKTAAKAAKAAGKEATKTASKTATEAAKTVKSIATETAKTAGKKAAKSAGGKEGAKRPATAVASKPTEAVRLFVASLEKGDKKQFLSLVTFDDMGYAGKLFDAAKTMRAFADAFEKAYGREDDEVAEVVDDLRLEDAIPTGKEVASKGRISVQDRATAVFELRGKKGKQLWLARTATGWKVRFEKLMPAVANVFGVEGREEAMLQCRAVALTCEALKDKIGQKGWSAEDILNEAEDIMDGKVEELSGEEEEEEEVKFDYIDPLWLP
jgi:hypothetical protein